MKIFGRKPVRYILGLKDLHSFFVAVWRAIFLIFTRKDYWRIIPSSIVIDIGANIGVLVLFAAISGARVMYAYEPRAPYTVLLKNIKTNRLDSIIKAEKFALVGLTSASVKFSRNSDVMNSILSSSSVSVDYDLMPTATLADIVSHLSAVDILNSDCEGGEYDIFLKAIDTDIQKNC